MPRTILNLTSWRQQKKLLEVYLFYMVFDTNNLPLHAPPQLYIWDVENDGIVYYNFASGKNDQVIISMFRK